jgi:hypothetical protein
MTKLRRLQLFLKCLATDIECGSHSGFKPCCVFCFSVLDNISFFIVKGHFYHYRRLINRLVSRIRHKNFHYIPCPYCVLLTDPVEVLNCRDVNHKLRYSDTEAVDIQSLGDIQTLYERLIKIDKIMDIILDEKPTYNYS